MWSSRRFLAPFSDKIPCMAQLFSINSDYKRSLLEALELFHGVDPADVQDLLQRCDRRDLAAGELLLSPGERNEHVFIVLSGSLDVHVGSPSTPDSEILAVCSYHSTLEPEENSR